MDMETIMQIVGRITLDYNLQLKSMGEQIERLKATITELQEELKEAKKKEKK